MMLAGVLLLCAFALLWQRRLTAMITLYRIEALAVSAAAFGQGFAHASDALYLTSIITLSIEVVLLPLALRRLSHRFDPIGAAATAVPVGVSMVLGVALIGIAVLAVPPGAPNAAGLPRQELAIALSVLLLGLLMMLARRHVLSQVIGFLSIENGLMLAAIYMPGMPWVAELAVALPVLAALPVAGLFMLPPANFETLKQ